MGLIRSTSLTRPRVKIDPSTAFPVDEVAQTQKVPSEVAKCDLFELRERGVKRPMYIQRSGIQASAVQMEIMATAATFQGEDQCPFVDPSRAFENCYGGRPRQVFLMKDF
jgi:hypothetical protein